MIVGVGANKGSPGATTLALLLGLCWPEPPVVCELDPQGADVPFRLPGADGGPLALSPSIATLAVDARPGAATRPVDLYAQQTALGVPVICGETSPRRYRRLAAHLPAIAQAMTGWAGTVIADLGCLQLWNPAMMLARTADALVLVTHTDTASLGHLRDRVEELAEDVGTVVDVRTQLAVVVRATPRDARAASARVEKLLASIGSPAVVAGAVVDDPKAAATLWSGSLPARPARSALLTSARSITATLHQLLAARHRAACAPAERPATAAPEAATALGAVQ